LFGRFDFLSIQSMTLLPHSIMLPRTYNIFYCLAIHEHWHNFPRKISYGVNIEQCFVLSRFQTLEWKEVEDCHKNIIQLERICVWPEQESFNSETTMYVFGFRIWSSRVSIRFWTVSWN
jgi:hypothetical protein